MRRKRNARRLVGHRMLLPGINACLVEPANNNLKQYMNLSSRTYWFTTIHEGIQGQTAHHDHAHAAMATVLYTRIHACLETSTHVWKLSLPESKSWGLQANDEIKRPSPQLQANIEKTVTSNMNATVIRPSSVIRSATSTCRSGSRPRNVRQMQSVRLMWHYRLSLRKKFDE